VSEPGDGRNIDPALGLLAGEGADQKVPGRRSEGEGTVPFDVWPGLPTDARAGDDPTYYERPVLKEPVWKWYVPAYFTCGGAAGAAATLGALSQLRDREGLGGLIRRCRWIAATGGAVGTFLLLIDLGRPKRFLNMLRVFRPSSPMNVGSWVLSTEAPLAAGSALMSSAGGLSGLLGDAAGLGAGVMGLPMTGYTAVLLANTAVPVWQQTRRTLPPLFVASAVCAAASLLQLMDLSAEEEGVVRRFAVAGAVGDLLAERAVERAAGEVEQVAKPLHEGRSGMLLRAAKACTVAGLAVNLLPGRSRGKRALAGLLGAMGAAAVKFGVVEAGIASARDPRATFRNQRAGRGGAEVTGRQAVAGP
jgi:formate-dependent nitrite reductase membrane component NrfD